ITNRFLKPDKKIVDLVGKEEVKAIVNARHTVISCPTEVLVTGIPDEIRCYGRCDTIKALLMKWTRFEEVQNIVGPYISHVIHKTRFGGYQSAREVLEDYKIFHSIRSKLVKGKKKLLIPINVSKYCYSYAVKEKALMLSGFSTMLSDAHIKNHHIGWIRQQLKEDDPKELILIAEIAIRNMDAWVKKMEKDVQSEISEQKKEKLKYLERFRNEFEKIIQNEFQAGDIAKMVLEFEELKWKVSREKENMETLSAGLGPLLDAYYNTLENVGNRLTRNKLEGEFKKLLSDEDSERDLAKEWSEVTRGMLKLD
ncbi:hypothetical protein MKW94_010807, partial [Papaver nudicaule]|nr:hypothetical protein [Papaver nudicaule]